MSIQAMNWALHLDVKPAAAKLLLIVIANYADDKDTAWPSKSRLANDCSLDKSGVCRHLATLEELGLITVTVRSADGANLSSLIKLNRERTPSGTGATSDGDTTSRTDATTLSRQCTGGSRAGALGVVAPVRHKPSIEPPIEPSGVSDSVREPLSISETEIRHRGFVISLPAIEMATLRSGLPKAEIKTRCHAHALQWAAEIDAGKMPRDVLPQKIANFLAASIMGEANRDQRPIHRASNRPVSPRTESNRKAGEILARMMADAKAEETLQ